MKGLLGIYGRNKGRQKADFMRRSVEADIGARQAIALRAACQRKAIFQSWSDLVRQLQKY